MGMEARTLFDHSVRATLSDNAGFDAGIYQWGVLFEQILTSCSIQCFISRLPF